MTLSRREREILDVIFAIGGEASAEDIREKLTDPPSYSAVRAMLAKLEAKGAVKHKEKGLRYVYSPTTPRKTARKSALRKLVDVFFEGSKEQVVTALLDDEKWSEDELDALAQQIAARQKERSGR
ncbi:MAG TPA: BlaI/MecI/CopY family transcriptional regulator [Thermoanaerobaculia bacterium]|nr:BlaI/MecI/CopY family transcriptional regulator [Thermoanaerobaculia bacterium]